MRLQRVLLLSLGGADPRKREGHPSTRRNCPRWEITCRLARKQITTCSAGSSRGGFDLEKILAAIQEHGVSLVFVIGGDGTHRGALQLLKGAVAAKLKLSIACVCKVRRSA